MIRQLKDDDKNDNDDYTEADGKKQILPPKDAKKRKSKITSIV